MRIDRSTPVSPVTNDAPVQPQVAQSSRPSGADVVQLSAAGTAAAQGARPADPARIASLKAAVADGSYKPDLDKLAANIVAEDK
jgi:flagellar biosynthesis anti-sigma factor FlgM